MSHRSSISDCPAATSATAARTAVRPILTRACAVIAACAMLAGTAACGGTSGASPSNTASTSESTSTSPSASESSASSSSDETASASQSASASAAAASSTCAASSLSATLTQGDGGGAGSSYPYLVLTNTGSADCTVYGYPGVSLRAGGQQIGAAAERDDSVTPTTITLKPGDSAHSQLRITNAGAFDESACGPTQADEILVYPPDQTDSLSIATGDYTGCSVADTPIMTVRALEPGDGAQ